MIVQPLAGLANSMFLSAARGSDPGKVAPDAGVRKTSFHCLPPSVVRYR
jgi:hypothetical protein